VCQPANDYRMTIQWRSSILYTLFWHQHHKETKKYEIHIMQKKKQEFLKGQEK
jgi:hypothetical protein